MLDFLRSSLLFDFFLFRSFFFLHVLRSSFPCGRCAPPSLCLALPAPPLCCRFPAAAVAAPPHGSRPRPACSYKTGPPGPGDGPINFFDLAGRRAPEQRDGKRRRPGEGGRQQGGRAAGRKGRTTDGIILSRCWTLFFLPRLLHARPAALRPSGPCLLASRDSTRAARRALDSSLTLRCLSRCCGLGSTLTIIDDGKPKGSKGKKYGFMIR